MSSAPVVGIDLGGTNMQIGVLSADGRIIGRCKRKTKAALGVDGVIERLVEGVARACAEAGVATGELGAIGAGIPGAIDAPRGVVYEAPNLRWIDVPIRDRLHEALGVPVAIDNDVNAALLGEARRGAGRGHPDLLGVWVGTGVGGALMLGNAIWRGPFFTAGEIGQTIASPTASPAKRTLEQNASRTGIVHTLELTLLQHPESLLHTLRRQNDDVIGSRQLAIAFESCDRAAVEAIEDAAELLGASIANVVTLLSIGAVVIGGGVTEALGQPFLDLIRRHFDRCVFPARLRSAALLLTELRDDAGVIGATLLAQELAASGK
jgi:glucokinase